MLHQSSQATIHIVKKEIKLQTCVHITDKNVTEDLILYKMINDHGKSEYFGTCILCKMGLIEYKKKELEKK